MDKKEVFRRRILSNAVKRIRRWIAEYRKCGNDFDSHLEYALLATIENVEMHEIY